MTTLTARDGHSLQAWVARPEGTPRGGVVVVQEIFGVNPHIRAVADGYAQAGYVAVAPALFDRIEPGIELGYEADDIARGRDIAFPMGFDSPLLDIEAAADAAREGGKVGVVGYCWGGSLAWLSSCRLGVDAAVGYYGGQITRMLEADASLKPQAPCLLHFGEHDAGIPLDMVEQVRAASPGVPIHLYDAGHGFNCDQRGSYDADSAKTALDRTLVFFGEHLG